MANLKVLFVYHHLAHYRSGVFAELQRRPGLECHFAADIESRDGSIPSIPPADIDRFYRLKSLWLGRALWQRGIFRTVHKQKFDAVVFLGDCAHLTTWLAAATCRVRQIPTLFWTIGWHRPEGGAKKRLRLMFYQISNHLLLYGNVGRRIGEEIGYPLNKMTVIGNSHSSSGAGIDDLSIEELRVLLPKNSSVVLTAVARMSSGKCLDLLLHAAAILKKRGYSPVVLLVGDGPELGGLRSLAKRLDVDLRAPGQIYSDEALRLIYACTTVSVIPANAGLSVVQSLKHGRPVITSDNPYRQGPEWEAITPGITGGHYADGDLTGLADEIERWLDRIRTRSASISELCSAEYLTRWSPQNHAGAIAHAIAEAIRRTRAGTC